MGKSLIESLAESINEQVQLLVKSVPASELPHLHEAAPFPPLDEKYPSPVAFAAFQKILTDAQTLVHMLQPSKVLLVDIAMQGVENQSLRLAVEWGIADVIEEAGGSIELAVLAKRYKTDEFKLGRILRTLAARHVFIESAPDVFSNNRHSFALVKNPQAKQFLRFTTIETHLAANGLVPSMEDPVEAFSYAPAHSPFGFAFNTEKDVFGWLMEPGHERALEDCSSGVNWLNGITVSCLINQYPWKKFGESATVIDLGCGPGTTAMSIVKVHNKLNWVMVDLPFMVPEIRKLWQREWPSVLESGQVRIEGHDYFQKNPFRGDIYFCRGVLREYEDQEALKFLLQIVPALRENPKSRIIFNEIVVPTEIVDKSKLLLAPSQYISATQSNYQRMAHLMTMNTWTMFGGLERTFGQFQALFDKAGLKLEKFYKFSIFTVMMECCLA